MLEYAVARAPFFLLVAVRCFAMLMAMPLFSARSVSRTAKVALAGLTAFVILPQADLSPYLGRISLDGEFSLEFLLLVIGEALIGIILGFYVSIIFSAFSTAGQFFAFQIGFAASEVYDSLSQVENPLMGQFLNLVAMLVFIQTDWVQLLFLKGLKDSFAAMNALTLAFSSEYLARFMLSGLTRLFYSALIIALPVMGTLFLINLMMGILTKAAPQMNLMAEGFPLMLLTAFNILTNAMRPLCEYFLGSFSAGFKVLQGMFAHVSGGGL